MIKITKVGYGLIPYGPGSGQVAISVYGEGQEDDNKKKLSKEAKSEKAREWAKAAVDQLEKDVDALEEGLWEKVMEFRKHYISIVILGDDWYKRDNIEYMSEFNDEVQRRSLDIQKTAIKSKNDLFKLAPPFTICAASPKYHTGTFDAYQWFNTLMIECPTKVDGKHLEEGTVGSAFNPFAVVEMMNHNLKSIIFKVEDRGDFEIIDKFYKEDHLCNVLNIGVFIIPMNKDIRADCREYALKNNYRYMEPIEGDMVMSF